MAKHPLPDIADLRNCLDYQPETGGLIWRPRPATDFAPTARESTEMRCRQWNTRCANKRAFSTSGKNGYLFGTFRGRPLTAHRVAWAITHGYWPTIVDHINGDRHDNRISNLREVDDTASNRNLRLQKRNISGVHGVQWDAGTQRWVARIGRNGKAVRLGAFVDLEDAKAARRNAEAEFGYHANHGR